MSMWEKFIKCLSKSKGGSVNNKCKFLNLSDIYKRVPKNQQKQFKLFQQKNTQYKARMEKFPTSLPKIDWKYYSTNVRPEYVTWVKHFQDQYEQFDTFFENRHALIDPSKYFNDVEEERKQVEKEVAEYKKESNDKIKCFEDRLMKLKALMPYEEMTMEEFCYAKPESAPDFINKPTFWPHTPEEQKPGPPEPEYEGHDKGEVSIVKPKDESPKGEPPKPKTPTDGQSGAKDSKPVSKTESSSPKKDDPNSKDGQKKPDSKTEASSPKKDDPNSKDAGKSTEVTGSQKKAESPIDVDKLAEAASEIATKGSAIVMDLAQKTTEAVKVWLKKLNEKRKEVEVAANKARDEAKQIKAVASEAKVDPEEVDSIYFREGSKNICNHTIIKGDEKENVEVKAKHVNLNEDFEDPIEDQGDVKYKKKSSGAVLNEDEMEAIEKRTQCEESQEMPAKKEKMNKKTCEAKAENPIKKDLEDMPCLEKSPENDAIKVKEAKVDCLKNREPKDSSEECMQKFLEREQEADLCKSTKRKPEKDPNTSEAKDTEKCSLNLESSIPSSSFKKPEPVDAVGTRTLNKTQPQSEIKTNEKALHDDSVTKKISIFLGKHIESKDKDNQFSLPDKSQISKDVQSKEKVDEENVENLKTIPDAELTVYPKLVINPKPKNEESASSAEKPISPPAKEPPFFITQVTSTPASTSSLPEKGKKTKEVLETAQEMAKTVFNMATDAAKLLSDATSAIEEAKKVKSARVENIEAAYLGAQKQADRALTEAYKAMGAAKKLIKRSRRNKEENNSELDELAMTEKHAMLAKLLARRAIALKQEIAKVLQELKDKQ